MAYIGNQPAPSNVNSDSITDGSITNADISPSAAIDVSKLDGVTATNTELNKLDGVTATTADLNVTAGADAAGVTASDIQKTQYLSGVSSDVQTQLDNASGASVKGTLTKSFTANETSTISLSAASTPTPIVSVTKEVAQVGVSSKGNWDVNSSGSNYDIEDTATATTLTPSVADDDGVFTLGSGSFASTDVGKRIVGNGGEAVLKTTAGAYELVTAFNDTSAIASGDWEMYAVKFDGTKAKLSGFFERANTTGNVTNSKVVKTITFPRATFNMTSFEFNQDKKKMYISSVGNSSSYQQFWSIGLNDAFDLSEVWFNNDEIEDAQAVAGEIYNLTASNDGHKVFFIDNRDNYNPTHYNKQAPAQAVIYERNAEKRYHYTYTEPSGAIHWDGENVDDNFNKIRFYNSGADIFMLCSGTTPRMLKYAAVTANSIQGLPTGATDYAQSLDISGNVGTTNPQIARSFDFSADGFNLYISDDNTDTMFHYQLTTAFDLTTASYVGSQTFSNIKDFRINDDGTKIMWIKNTSINVTTLSTAYSIATLGSTETVNINSNNTNTNEYARDIVWANSGQELFFSVGDNYIRKMVCTEAYNLDTAKQYIQSTDSSKTNSANVSTNWGVALSDDGTKIVWIGNTNTSADTIKSDTMSTAFDLGTLSGSPSAYTQTNTSYHPMYFPRIQYSTNGITQYVYTMASQDKFFMRQSFSTHWSAGTLSGVSVQSMSESNDSRGDAAYGLAFNDSGTSFVTSAANATYFKHRDNGNANTARYSYPTVSFSFSKGAAPSTCSHNAGLALDTLDIGRKNQLQFRCPTAFNNDGTGLLVTHWTTDNPVVSEIKLDAAYSISTTFNRDNSSNTSYQSLGLSGFTGQTQGIYISEDGTKLFYISQTTGTNNPVIHSRTFGTPWDLTTLGATVTSKNLSFSGLASGERIRNLQFTHGGKWFWTWNGDDGQFYGAPLSTAYDITTTGSPIVESWNGTIGSYGGVSISNTPGSGTGPGNCWHFTPDGQAVWVIYRTSTSATNHIHALFSLRKPFRPDQGYTSSYTYSTSGNLIRGTSTSSDYPQMAFYEGRGNEVYVGAYRGDFFNQDASDPVTSRFDPVIFRTYEATSNTYSHLLGQNTINDFLGITRLATFMSNASDAHLTPDGKYLFVLNESGGLYRIEVQSEYLKDVTPHDQYIPLVTNNTGQIDTADWTDINSMDADDGGDGVKYYAFSTDGRTTFKISDNTNGTRNIIRDNSGTWQYNSNTTYGSETWANATSNTIYSALRDALAVTQNQMTTSQLEAVSDAQFFATGSTFDLAIILRSSEGIDAAPYSDGVSVNYDAAALNKGAILGTDYDYDVPSSTSVRITSLAAQNLKVKVL